MSQAMTRMSQARGRLILTQVFWAALVLSLPMVVDNSIPTAATDYKHIFYNEAFIESLDLPVVLFVIAHEAAHVMFLHALRRGSRHPLLWNIACDHAINLLLQKCGFKVWEKACCDKRFEGMSAEQIYDKLLEEAKARGGKGGKDAGEGTIGPDGQYQPTPGDGEGIGGDIIYVPLDPGQAREAEREIKGKVVQAATQAKMCGRLPQELAIAIGQMTNPPKRWQDIYRAYMRQPASDTENWTRRNRRYTDDVMPGRWNLRMGEMIWIGDTSGSMTWRGGNVFAQMGAELTEIAEQLKPTQTRIIWADDTDCGLQEVFQYGEKIVLHPRGGGGTDMRKPLKYVERFNPLVVTLFTDCDTPWPSRVPYPLVVASITDRKAPSSLAPTVFIPTK